MPDIDLTLANKLWTAVTKSQAILAEFIDPLTELSQAEVINELYGILDDEKLVEQMQRAKA